MHIRSTVFLYFCESSNSKLLDCTALFFLFSVLLVLAVVHNSFSPSFLFRDVESAMMRLRRGRKKKKLCSQCALSLPDSVHPSPRWYFFFFCFILWSFLYTHLCNYTCFSCIRPTTATTTTTTNKKQGGRRKPDENTSFSIPWLEALFFFHVCLFRAKECREDEKTAFPGYLFISLCLESAAHCFLLHPRNCFSSTAEPIICGLFFFS